MLALNDSSINSLHDSKEVTDEEEGRTAPTNGAVPGTKKTILPVVVYFIFDWQDLVSETRSKVTRLVHRETCSTTKTHTDSPNDQNQQ